MTRWPRCFILNGDYRLLVGRDLRDAVVFRARVEQTLFFAALLTLALGLVGGLFMTRNVLRRIEAVNRTSASIIQGDFSERVPVTGSGDEFDQLAANLNAMLDQIERLMAGMRQVTDNIAHDLRTPLSRLRARLEVTLLERPDTNRYAEALAETIAEADHLLGTFNALLSIAEAEAGARAATPWRKSSSTRSRARSPTSTSRWRRKRALRLFSTSHRRRRCAATATSCRKRSPICSTTR